MNCISLYRRTAISLLFLLVSMASSLAQVPLKDLRVNLSAESMSLEEILLQIEEQTGLSFFYLNEQIRSQNSLDLNYADVSLEQVLADLARKSQVQFHRKDNQIVIKPSAQPEKKAVAFGSITGQVIDAVTGDPLPGASVFIKGTNVGSSTDLTGEYLIRKVPEGAQTIVVNYLGYEVYEAVLQIEADVLMTHDAPLTSNVATLEEIVVKGSLEGQEKALNQQRTADNIKNVISADLIGRFPDVNVAEALQRVPGITINRERGEGSTVQIRGTPAHYTSISINGEQIPSTQEGGSRNESLDLIPSDVLSSLEVTKALTPDMDGDAVGGAINLRTPTAKNLEPSMKVEVGGGYNDMSRGLNGLGRIKYGQRFFPSSSVDEGRLGVIFNGSYYQTDNVQDIGEAVWDYPRLLNRDQDSVLSIMDYRYRDLFNIRTRTGASFTLDYKFNSRHSLIFNAMYSRRGDEDQRSRARYDPDVGTFVTPTLSQNARIRRDLSIRDEVKNNITYNLEGDHTLGTVHLDYGLFYTDSRREGNSDYILFDRRTFDIEIEGLNTDFPTFRPVEFPGTIHNPVLYDDLNRFERNATTGEGTNTVARLNLEVPYLLGNAKGLIRGGGKVRQIHNARARDSEVFLYLPVNDDDVFANLIDDFEDSRYMNGNVRFGPRLNADQVQGYFRDNREDFALDVGNTRINSDQADYEADELVSAAYLMTRLQFNKLMLLAGVRAEFTSVDYKANVVRRNQGSWESTTPVTGGTDFNFVLPNVHVRYSPNPLTNLRAALTYSYARPNFVDLVPYDDVDFNSRTIERGNPDLLPAEAINLDLMVERYLNNVGILSGGLFYKYIQDYQVNRSFRLDSGNFEQYVTDPTLINYRFEQAQNGEAATVYGLEVNLQKQLDFLPGALNGLGVYLNYSYVYSRATLNDGRRIRLPNQTDHFGNFALTYDWKGFTGRASVNYIGGVLLEVSDEDGALDLFREGRYQLDVSANYRFTPRISAFAEFLNLTNTPLIEFFGERNRVAQIEYIGWWNRFGISYKF
ncbi:TonB-dependent receptor [Tunicatimonas pelagia]|uniref:TonB-dependent receptor n=1 Tax=Tunicatimonas pelagia TaxID=931531 RepID=UPI002666B9BF|nr:TonB-dependent receptor [Tunicatimonas pelagia]WKN42107.1 TonB-dependent receptor [Tunicatimonas pelagia]